MLGLYFDEKEYNQLGLKSKFWEQTSFQRAEEFLLAFKNTIFFKEKNDIENDLDFQLSIIKTIINRNILNKTVRKEEVAINGVAVLISLKIRFNYFVSLIEKEEENSLMYKRIAFAIYHVIDHKEKIEKEIDKILQWSEEEESENAIKWIMTSSVCEIWGVCVHDYALIPSYSRSCVGLNGGDVLSILPIKEEYNKTWEEITKKVISNEFFA